MPRFVQGDEIDSEVTSYSAHGLHSLDTVSASIRQVKVGYAAEIRFDACWRSWVKINMRLLHQLRQRRIGFVWVSVFCKIPIDRLA
jgi:hypothetical protein